MTAHALRSWYEKRAVIDRAYNLQNYLRIYWPSRRWPGGPAVGGVELGVAAGLGDLPPRPPGATIVRFVLGNCNHWARVNCWRISNIIAAFARSISLRA